MAAATSAPRSSPSATTTRAPWAASRRAAAAPMPLAPPVTRATAPGQRPGDPRRVQRLPREIEEVLYAHPAILEAAVIGKPDERLGEEVVAVVALRPGHDVSAVDIIAYTRQRLAACEYPREIRFMAELPRGPSGKILKSALHDG